MSTVDTTTRCGEKFVNWAGLRDDGKTRRVSVDVSIVDFVEVSADQLDVILVHAKCGRVESFVLGSNRDCRDFVEEMNRALTE